MQEDDKSQSEEKPGWFDQPGRVRQVQLGLYVACGLFVLIDLVFRLTGFDKHPYFEWERWPGFYGVYGFVACVLFVLTARFVWRPLVKRDEDFYEKDLTRVEADREAIKAALDSAAKRGKEGADDE